MSALIFAFIPCYLFCCKPFHCDCIKDGSYLSRERTTMLNGIFILFVFVAHALAYPLRMDMVNAHVYGWLMRYPAQLIVACFLFYSGYGVAESIRKKGMAYVKSMPATRVAKVFLHFGLAVSVFAIVQAALGTPVAWSKYVLAFVGWKSIGNSNWYIFVILCCYLCMWISCRLSTNSHIRAISLLATTAGLTVLLCCCKPDFWWNTIPCFPAGALLSMYHKHVHALLLRLPIPPSLCGFVLVLAAILMPLRYTLFACVPFAFGISLAFSGIRFRKKPVVLLWLGHALFSVYIFQRIPMLVMARYGIFSDCPDLFLTVAFVATLSLAWGAGYVWCWMDTIFENATTRKGVSKVQTLFMCCVKRLRSSRG